MDENSAYNNIQQQNFTSIVTWIIRHLERNGGGEEERNFDCNNASNNASSDYQEHKEEMGGDNDNQPQNTMFCCIQSLNDYEESRALLESYRSTQEYLKEIKVLKQMESLIVNDIEQMSPAAKYVYDSTWFLDDISDVSENEPSKTESEVYDLGSSNESNISKSTVHNLREKIFDTSNSKNKIFDKLCDKHERMISSGSNQNNSLILNIENNPLLRACIQDINYMPINVNSLQISFHTLPHLFHDNEISIMHHFMKYKIKAKINEINKHIEEVFTTQNRLAEQFNKIRTTNKGALTINPVNVLSERTIDKVNGIIPLVHINTKEQETKNCVIMHTSMIVDTEIAGETKQVTQITREMAILSDSECRSLLHERAHLLTQEELKVAMKFIASRHKYRLSFRIWHWIRQIFKSKNRKNNSKTSNDAVK